MYRLCNGSLQNIVKWTLIPDQLRKMRLASIRTLLILSSPVQIWRLQVMLFDIYPSTYDLCSRTWKVAPPKKKKKRKVGFTLFFPRFADSDVLIQCMSITTHWLSNQTLYWSKVTLYIPDALPEEYRWCFYSFELQTFRSKARNDTTTPRRQP